MKKFTDKYNKNFNYTLIGFEFEFFSNVSYYKTLEVLNSRLDPIKVYGFKNYHSDFTPTENKFKIEPDHSGGSNMVELVTGPIPYVNSKIILFKILNFIKEFGRTNEKCAVHMNISFDKKYIEKEMSSINSLKMILNFDEEAVYSKFPERQNNIYAKSIKSLIPFKNYSYTTNAISIVQNNFHTPNKKYYGINFSHLNNQDNSQRLEFRYCGGKDYHLKVNELEEMLDYFVEETWLYCDQTLDKGDVDKLETYMSKNIEMYDNFATLKDFIVDHPSIDLSVNSNNAFDYVNSYFIKFKDKLFELFTHTKEINNCIINYDSTNNVLEIVDTDVEIVLDIKKFTFIECRIKNSMLTKCNLIDCDIEEAHISSCEIHGSEIKNSKLLNCTVLNDTVLTDCFYNGGLMDGKMEGGIFRAGTIGTEGELSSTTKIINDTSNDFFGNGKETIKKKK